MEANADQSAWWNRNSGKPFAHTLDAERFSRTVPLDARILDYGCGQGRLCGELARLGYQNYCGIDFASEMLRVARERNPGGRFLANEGTGVPAGAQSFDAVLLFAVLTCIPDDAAQKKLLAEFKRILAPGGLLLLSDYPLQADARNLDRYRRFADELGGYGRFRIDDGAVLRHHRREWFEELLAGFTVEHAAEIDGLTMNGNPARILQLWARREQ